MLKLLILFVIVGALITTISSSEYCEKITSMDFNAMTPLERLDLSIKCMIEEDKQGIIY